MAKADELFKEYEKTKTKKKKWRIIKNIVNLVEINPKYNFELLKLNKFFEKNDYQSNFNQLAQTLSKNDYFSLAKTKQENPSLELYNLLNLYLNDRVKFEGKTKNIRYNKYNIPLIERNEKMRINYYIQSFCHYEIYLNDSQKAYLSKTTDIICDDDRNKLNKFKMKYNNIKNGIKFFSKLIPKMKDFFMNINVEEDNFNIKIFLFIFYINYIIQRVRPGKQAESIIQFFIKEIDPTIELDKIKSSKNIMNEKKRFIFPRILESKKYLKKVKIIKIKI